MTDGILNEGWILSFPGGEGEGGGGGGSNFVRFGLKDFFFSKKKWLAGGEFLFWGDLKTKIRSKISLIFKILKWGEIFFLNSMTKKRELLTSQSIDLLIDLLTYSHHIWLSKYSISWPIFIPHDFDKCGNNSSIVCLGYALVIVSSWRFFVHPLPLKVNKKEHLDGFSHLWSFHRFVHSFLYLVSTFFHLTFFPFLVSHDFYFFKGAGVGLNFYTRAFATLELQNSLILEYILWWKSVYNHLHERLFPL